MYPAIYLNDAMENLGAMCEYAASDLHMELNEFWTLFIAGGLAGEIAKGNCAYVAGRSGPELAIETLQKTGYQEDDFPRPGSYFDRSEYYWAGWILAFYQWYSGYSFAEIQEKLPMSRVVDMYYIHHEMSERRVAEDMDLIMESERTEGNKLAMRRRLMGYSQRLLSEKSGVNLRSLQQYEINAKDIRKASGETIYKLSRALCCNMEDLM